MSHQPGLTHLVQLSNEGWYGLGYLELPQSQRGTVTISGADTSATVTFDHPLLNATYFPFTTAINSSGAVNANSRITYVSGRATTGMTVNVHTAPGAGTSVTVAWWVAP